MPALGHSHVKQYLPLLSFATCVPLEGKRAVGHFTELGKQLDLGAAELVISSSHLVAKGVLTAPDQLRIS